MFSVKHKTECKNESVECRNVNTVLLSPTLKHENAMQFELHVTNCCMQPQTWYTNSSMYSPCWTQSNQAMCCTSQNRFTRLDWAVYSRGV